jgi:hypothetical protein
MLSILVARFYCMCKKSDPSPSPPFRLSSTPQSQNIENHSFLEKEKKNPKKIRVKQCCGRSPFVGSRESRPLSFEIRCTLLQCSEKFMVHWKAESWISEINFLLLECSKNWRYNEFLESIPQCRLFISLSSSDPWLQVNRQDEMFCCKSSSLYMIIFEHWDFDARVFHVRREG